MFVLVVFVEMVAKRESALVHTHRAHARRKRIVATVYYIKRKKKRSRKCRSRFFSSSTSQKKKKKRSLSSGVLPERERNKKEKEYETHRHFDASGRLPADFHVEEHDWVGHDDDFDSKKK